MDGLGIDQSKLPGVKEVCRDFAVLEDHTLAHNLQEQEIEHHLATNVQRNRLVQHDLQMAKLLQEEEDRKAQVRIQERRKNIERQDCEIAQEIQVKLVIEAEQRRRQEEDDEDIARILQQKELQEEKRRKKPPAEPVQHSSHEKGPYPESRDHSCDSLREPTSACLRSPQPQSGDRQLQRPREHRRGPPLVSEGLDLEVLGSTSEARKARSGQRHRREKQDRKPGSWEPAVELEDDELERSSRGRRREPVSQERLRGPPAFILDGELECAGGGSRERRPRGQERTCAQDRADDGSHLYYDRKHVKRQERRLPSLETSPNPVMEERHPNRRRSSSHSPDVARRRLPLEGRPASKAEARHRDLEELSRQGPRRDVERERERAGYGTRAILHRGENWEMESGGQRSPGTKSRGTKEAIYQKPRPTFQEQEFYDAEIARKLQEEELLASQVDKRAAQVAQDEEIARLLMAEEKKAYKKAKDRERGSSDKKRRDQDGKQDPNELMRPRSREGHEPHRPRSDKPTRPPPPFTEDPDHPSSPASQHRSVHEAGKPDPSHRGFRYKQ